MARFYGTIQGARGPASRLGHANTGLHVSAQSYSGDINVYLDSDGETDLCTIVAGLHGGGTGVTLYCGPIKHLVDLEGHNFLVHEMAQRALENEHASD